MMRALLLLSMVGLLGCSEPFSPGERLRAIRAFERWQAHAPASYTFETRTSCFCGGEHVEWATVTVWGQTVVGVRTAEGIDIPASRRSEWHTVDEIFSDLIRTENGGFLADLRVEYDPEWSYPTVIERIADANVMDGGSTIHLRNLLGMPVIRPE